MESLKESKEVLPISFITSFVSDGWEKVGFLKEEMEAIRKDFSGTKKIESLIQSLIDAYLVCIGQMEQHLSDKDYLEFPEDKMPVIENLQEDVTVNIEKVEVIKPKIKIKPDDKISEIQPETPVSSEVEMSTEEVTTENKSDIEKLAEVEETCKPTTMVENCDFLFDEFPDPVKEEDRFID